MAGAAPDFDREVDPQQQIRHFLGVVRRGWLAIFTCLGAGLLVGVAAFFFIPKTYVSSAKLEVHGDWMFDSAAEARDLGTLAFSARRRNLEDHLRSTKYVEDVLDRLEWDDWSRAKEGGDVARREFLRKVKEKLDTRITSGELGERFVFVNFAWYDRFRAAAFVETITRYWIDTALEGYVVGLRDDVNVATQVLAQKEQTLLQASLALEQFEVRNEISGIDQRQGVQVELDNLTRQRAVVSTNIADLETKVEALEKQLLATDADGALLLPPTLASSSPLVNSQRADALAQIESTVKMIEQRKISGFTDKDRKLQQLVLALRLQFVALSQQTGEGSAELASIPNPDWKVVKDDRDRYYLDLQGAIAQRTTIDAAIEQTKESLRTLPEVLRVHRQLQMDKTVQEQIVTDHRTSLQPLRDKLAEAELRGSARRSPVTELEKPVPATIPSAFLGLIALAMSTLLGLGLALLSVIGREFLRSSFRSPEQARRTLRLPVLGEVASIQTVPEVRRARFVRLVQMAASLLLLGGLGAAIWICVAHPNDLPRALVDWAMELRTSLL